MGFGLPHKVELGRLVNYLEGDEANHEEAPAIIEIEYASVPPRGC